MEWSLRDITAKESVSSMTRILRKKVLNPSVTLLEVEAPRIAKKARAGQFIILRLDGPGERISAASWPLFSPCPPGCPGCSAGCCPTKEAVKSLCWQAQ